MSDINTLIPEANYEAITNAFKRFGEALINFGKLLKITAENMRELSELVKICSYPDKKIVYLALHSKKARVRKKNRNRILRDLKRSNEK